MRIRISYFSVQRNILLGFHGNHVQRIPRSSLTDQKLAHYEEKKFDVISTEILTFIDPNTFFSCPGCVSKDPEIQPYLEQESLA